LEKAGINPDMRAEALNLDDWTKLTKIISPNDSLLQ